MAKKLSTQIKRQLKKFAKTGKELKAVKAARAKKPGPIGSGDGYNPNRQARLMAHRARISYASKKLAAAKAAPAKTTKATGKASGALANKVKAVQAKKIAATPAKAVAKKATRTSAKAIPATTATHNAHRLNKAIPMHRAAVRAKIHENSRIAHHIAGKNRILKEKHAAAALTRKQWVSRQLTSIAHGKTLISGKHQYKAHHANVAMAARSLKATRAARAAGNTPSHLKAIAKHGGGNNHVNRKVLASWIKANRSVHKVSSNIR